MFKAGGKPCQALVDFAHAMSNCRTRRPVKVMARAAPHRRRRQAFVPVCGSSEAGRCKSCWRPLWLNPFREGPGFWEQKNTEISDLRDHHDFGLKRSRCTTTSKSKRGCSLYDVKKDAQCQYESCWPAIVYRVSRLSGTGAQTLPHLKDLPSSRLFVFPGSRCRPSSAEPRYAVSANQSTCSVLLSLPTVLHSSRVPQQSHFLRDHDSAMPSMNLHRSATSFRVWCSRSAPCRTTQVV